jgi:hypothetical protein
MATRPFETTFYKKNKSAFRNTRAASSASAVARAFQWLENYGEPGQVAVTYDLKSGKLYAELKVSVANIDVHYYR